MPFRSRCNMVFLFVTRFMLQFKFQVTPSKRDRQHAYSQYRVMFYISRNALIVAFAKATCVSCVDLMQYGSKVYAKTNIAGAV